MNQTIIIGGGSSIKEGILLGLQEKLKSTFNVGINYAYKFFDCSILVCVDRPFYERNKKEIKSIPLIICRHFDNVEYLDNTISIVGIHGTYRRNLVEGVYSPRYSGMFALSLAIFCSEPGDEIYLLGYDYNYKGKTENGRYFTHFYQGKIEHRGVGRISQFRPENARRDYEPFKWEREVKIYNVSLTSLIPYFDKISYEEFFKRIKPISDKKERLERWTEKLENNKWRSHIFYDWRKK